MGVAMQSVATVVTSQPSARMQLSARGRRNVYEPANVTDRARARDALDLDHRVT